MLNPDLLAIRTSLLDNVMTRLMVQHEADTGGSTNGGHMSMMGMNFSLGIWIFVLAFIALGMLLLLFIGSAVYQHATQNNISYPLLWAILAVTMPMVGIPLYVLVASLSSTRMKRATTVPPAVRDKTMTARYEQVSVSPKSTSQLPIGNDDAQVEYCPSCGDVVGKKDLFCSNCGQKLT